MKLKLIFFQLCLIAAIALSGCDMLNKTYSNYDKSVDFTKYKTYAWLNSQNPNLTTPYYNDVIENNAKSYVDRYFRDRQYTVDTLNPDLLLELVTKSKKKTENIQASNPYNYSNYTYYNYPYNQSYNNTLYYNNQYYNRYNYYNYSRHYSYNHGYRTKTRRYTQSIITINVIDRVSNKLIWTGSAENDIYNPVYLKEEIHPSIVNILRQYPIKSINKNNSNNKNKNLLL